MDLSEDFNEWKEVNRLKPLRQLNIDINKVGSKTNIPNNKIQAILRFKGGSMHRTIWIYIMVSILFFQASAAIIKASPDSHIQYVIVHNENPLDAWVEVIYYDVGTYAFKIDGSAATDYFLSLILKKTGESNNNIWIWYDNTDSEKVHSYYKIVSISIGGAS